MILDQPKPGDPRIVVEGVHESTIRIVAKGKDANGQDIDIDIGGGTCYGRTSFGLDSLSGDKPIQPIQSFDCPGAVWEVSGPPVWPISRFLEFEADEAKIIELTNKERQDPNHNCGPLQADPKLMNVARAHSQDLASHPGLYDAPPPAGKKQAPGHYSSDGKSAGERITAAMGAGWTAENVCRDVETGQQAFDLWLNSPLHHANLTNCDYTLIGVGIAQAPDGRRYFTLDFFHP